jgi:predicted small metal-binding protein
VSDVDPQKVITCDCGFEAVGTADDLVQIMQAHELDSHGVEISREDVLTLAVEIDGEG